MKRLATLLMALCLVLGSAVSASAIEVQVSGVMDFVFGYNSNLGFVNVDDVESAEERTMARQRARIVVELIASENLRGVFQFQIGAAADWGDVNDGGDMWEGTGGPGFFVRRAYIDWMVPNTDLRVKMGYQQLTLPFANMGNPMFDANVGAVVATAGLTDEASLTAFWARPFQTSALGSGDNTHGNLTDSFGLVFDYSGDMFSISPWVMYTMIGQNSGFLTGDDAYVGNSYLSNADEYKVLSLKEDIDHYAFGLALKVMPTDALTIKFDGMYGSTNSANAVLTGWNRGDPDVLNNNNLTGDFKMSGYWFALGIDYELDWGTPGFFAWYSSGDDFDDVKDGELGRLPAIGQDGGVWFSSFGFAGAMTACMDGNLNGTGIGTWGAGLQIANMSFVEDLSHVARVLYWQGTNDKEIGNAATGYTPVKPGYGTRETVYLTTEDTVYEVNFNTDYKIYENLTTTLELGYMYMDADSDLNKNLDENSYSAALIFRYGF